MNKFKTFAELKWAVAEARGRAGRDARGHCPWVWSRGTHISTTGISGQCHPCEAAEAIEWKGTKKEITELVATVLARYPGVTKIWIEGGYDGGQYMSDRDDGNYDPWITSWEVLVWERPEGPLMMTDAEADRAQLDHEMMEPTPQAEVGRSKAKLRADVVASLTSTKQSPEMMLCWCFLAWESKAVQAEAPEAKALYEYAIGLTLEEREEHFAEARAARQAMLDSAYVI